MEEWCQITILQEDKQVAIKCMEGKTLLEAMLRQGVRYRCDCGGRGTCGQCKVQVVSGEPKKSRADVRLLTEEELESGYRLACKAYPGEDIVIRVPVYEEDSMAILSAGHGGTAPPGESRLFYRN
ncbi:2Fe-2S iron-sulfur cluster-binding protein [Anaerotaenia torta]|uniref:2Fe-2S iron-sulfur cluster-binding protein n=1 Tax=Anaerotaenia torta TaxID=433293 RepID=UPI003D19C4A7